MQYKCNNWNSFTIYQIKQGFFHLILGNLTDFLEKQTYDTVDDLIFYRVTQGLFHLILDNLDFPEKTNLQHCR